MSELCRIKLETMKAIFDKITIKSIHFQSNTNEILLSCDLTIGSCVSHSNLIIDSSDFNRMLGKIQQVNNYIDTEALFEKYEIENEDFMYIWKDNQFECSLYDYTFHSQTREIRA